MDEFNRRLAQADGLKAEPDPNLGGAINLVRPTLAGAERLHAAQRGHSHCWRTGRSRSGSWSPGRHDSRVTGLVRVNGDHHLIVH